ncbi:MAG: hypothetical protein M3R65_08425 [Gemmatimonadota bacterium]|nr:hypothetical protein [Gemmatimonadota bacterium]
MPRGLPKHVVGFVGLSLVSGVVIAGLGWCFWRGRPDITLLILGTLQALLGLAVYVERFRIGRPWRSGQSTRVLA